MSDIAEGAPATHAEQAKTALATGAIDTRDLLDAWRAMLALVDKLNLPVCREVEYQVRQHGLFNFSNCGREAYVTLNDDRFISVELARNGEYDFAKFQMALGFLGPLDTVVDVGANIGTICIPAVARGLARRAIAIEPDPLNFRVLMANLHLNDVAERIVAHRCAAGPRDGETLLLERALHNSGDHRIRLRDQPGALGEERRVVVETPSRRLDDLLAPHDPDPAKTLVWMDVQGFEANVMAGAPRLLASRTPFVVEFCPYCLDRNGATGALIEHATRHFSRLVVLAAGGPQELPATPETFARLLAALDPANPFSACDLLLF